MAAVPSNTDQDGLQVPNSTPTVTFTSKAIGAAAADRLVFVTIGFFSGTIKADPSSVTIGGIIATKAVAANGTAASGTFSFAEYIYWAAVPTGTTANIVVTFPSNAGTQEYLQISVYRVVGANTTTPVLATAVSNTFTGNTDVVSTSITVPSGGCLIAGAGGFDAGNSLSMSWTNATMDTHFDGAFTTDGYSSASSTSATTSTRTFSNSAGTNTPQQLVAVAIQAAGPVIHGLLLAFTSAQSINVRQGIQKSVAVQSGEIVSVGKSQPLRPVIISSTWRTVSTQLHQWRNYQDSRREQRKSPTGRYQD